MKYYGMASVGMILALCTGSSFGLLPRDVMAGVQFLKHFAKSLVGDASSPLQQLQTYAEATLLTASAKPEDTYLNTLFMEDARSYFQVDNFETTRELKVDAVEQSLSMANIPNQTQESIMKQIRVTKHLRKQFHNFVLDSNGTAVLYIVNLWMQQHGDDVQVALMLCGCEFKQGAEGLSIQEEEVQYEDVTTKTKRSRTGWEEIVVEKRPLTVDGKTPLMVKTPRRITDPKKMKPSEVEELKEYLNMMASRQMLQNTAPHKVPVPLTQMKLLKEKVQ